MTYTLIIFDLDGTLLDTSEGICNSCLYAANKLNLQKKSKQTISNLIGQPIYDIYLNEYGLKPEIAETAVSLFRGDYDRNGKTMAQPYPGMQELLQSLKEDRKIIAIVTMKPSSTAEDMLNRFNFLNNIDVIYGRGDNESMSKKRMIEMCMKKYHVTPRDCIVVGDSEHDRNGAREANTNFIGVTYGYGFKEERDVTSDYHTFVANNSLELLDILLKDTKTK